MKHINFIPCLLSALAFTACSDNDTRDTNLPEAEYGSPNEWYYAGGKFGTTNILSAYAYRQASTVVDEAGLSLTLQFGESTYETWFKP